MILKKDNKPTKVIISKDYNLNDKALKKATFAGGCFWCMEPPFERLDGVVAAVSGYSGGEKENPNYHKVSGGGIGYFEAIQIIYDPKKVSYEELVRVFFMNIDPTDSSGQFADRGHQYKTAIFYHDSEQKKIAEKSKKELEKSGKFESEIVTQIIPLKNFYEAEEYHQDYYKKNPIAYKMYKLGSGRERYIQKMWGEGKNA